MSRADSIRQTASIARWVSGAVTAPDHIIVAPRRRKAVRRHRAYFFAPTLRAQALFLLAQLGRELGAEVLRLEHLADLDLASRSPSDWGSA